MHRKLHPRGHTRPAAILVCVMVVLLIVALTSAQTVQTMLLVRRADEQRSRIRQVRELVELGRLSLAREQVPASGQLELTVDGQVGRIRFIQLESETPSPRFRIVAEFPAHHEQNQVVATWETPQ
ncbi:MAG: hypothetical protein R3C53_00355 [Pirellulaceae bacterium]